jgi:hypothetical protein
MVKFRFARYTTAGTPGREVDLMFEELRRGETQHGLVTK